MRGLPVKAYIYLDIKDFYNPSLSLETIGHIQNDGIFKWIDINEAGNSEMREICYLSLKKKFSYKGSAGCTLTIPYFRELDVRAEDIGIGIDYINNNTKIVKRYGYVIAYNCVIPEKEDGKKYILTYKKK